MQQKLQKNSFTAQAAGTSFTAEAAGTMQLYYSRSRRHHADSDGSCGKDSDGSGRRSRRHAAQTATAAAE
jgi:hypothetical protein